jgi:cytochrome c
VLRFARIATVFITVGVGSVVSAAARGQDAAHGKHVFNMCSACHNTGHSSRIGPGLEGVLNRKSGSMSGFRYSRAMKSADLVWDEKTLDAFITSPQKVVPGTTMPFSGIRNSADRADLLAYLQTLN